MSKNAKHVWWQKAILKQHGWIIQRYSHQWLDGIHRSILAVAAQRGWCVYQLDVKSAFLYGELKEEVYIDQPEGYLNVGEEDKVYRLKKALYGL